MYSWSIKMYRTPREDDMDTHSITKISVHVHLYARV